MGQFSQTPATFTGVTNPPNANPFLGLPAAAALPVGVGAAALAGPNFGTGALPRRRNSEDDDEAEGEHGGFNNHAPATYYDARGELVDH
jgi:hypothetical protein